MHAHKNLSTKQKKTNTHDPTSWYTPQKEQIPKIPREKKEASRNELMET
jgi:hypothetical protein